MFCTNSPLQEAAACGLEQAKERKFFETQVAEYQERRDILTAAFEKLGMKYILPEGSYFVLLVSLLLRFGNKNPWGPVRISPTLISRTIIPSPQAFWDVEEISSA